MYAYGANNPIKYTDPDGRVFCLVTAGIGAGLGFAYGAYKSYTENGFVDWGEATKDALIGGVVGLGLGAASAFVLTGSATASTAVVSAGVKATAAVTVSSASALINNSWGNLEKAGEYGIKIYSELRKSLANTGLQAHHIIEQRFLPALQKLGLSANKMLSVAVTPEEHQKFTNAWRSAFAYGTDYANLTISEIWKAAQQIYAEYPELLKAAAQTLGIE